MTDRSQVYLAHLHNELLPGLETTRETLAMIQHDIMEYEEVVTKTQALSNKPNPSKAEETLVELGGGVWVDARVSDTSIITLDLGTDLYMDLPVKEASAYASKRISVLKRKELAMEKKAEMLLWQIEQFQGALTQVNGDMQPSSA